MKMEIYLIKLIWNSSHGMILAETKLVRKGHELSLKTLNIQLNSFINTYKMCQINTDDKTISYRNGNDEHVLFCIRLNLVIV